MDKPHQYSRDEIRDLFLEKIRVYIDYWHKEPRKNKYEALEGLAHSILVLIDGESADFPAFHLLPMTAPSDQKYDREHGNNWFPILAIQSEYDIAGDLHDNLFKSKQEQPPAFPVSPWYLAIKFRAFGFSFEDIDRLADICVERAKHSAMSAEGHLTQVYYQLLNGQTTKEELLKPMEHILVITNRQLKDIMWCMEYSHNYDHGADGHNRMKTCAQMAEFIGFVWNEKDNKVEIPQHVRVEDAALTGR